MYIYIYIYSINYTLYNYMYYIHIIYYYIFSYHLVYIHHIFYLLSNFSMSRPWTLRRSSGSTTLPHRWNLLAAPVETPSPQRRMHPEVPCRPVWSTNPWGHPGPRGPRGLRGPRSPWGVKSLVKLIELDDGKIYRKTLYLMVKVKTMVSCRFSLKPIHWKTHEISVSFSPMMFGKEATAGKEWVFHWWTDNIWWVLLLYSIFRCVSALGKCHVIPINSWLNQKALGPKYHVTQWLILDSYLLIP